MILEILVMKMNIFFSNESRPASLVWSGQISSIKKGTPEPINLTFGVNADTNLTHSFRCVFWDGVLVSIVFVYIKF